MLKTEIKESNCLLIQIETFIYERACVKVAEMLSTRYTRDTPHRPDFQKKIKVYNQFESSNNYICLLPRGIWLPHTNDNATLIRSLIVGESLSSDKGIAAAILHLR